MGGIIFKVDIATGKVLVDNLEELWQQHNSNSGLKKQVHYTNPAMQPVQKQIHKHLFNRIKKFNKNRYNKWLDEDLYQLVELVFIENKGYKVAATKLGRSKGACKQMMHHLRKAGVIYPKSF